MSKRIFKNYQINLGMPFQVKVPMDEMFDGHFFADGGEGGAGGEAAEGGWDGGGGEGDGWDDGGGEGGWDGGDSDAGAGDGEGGDAEFRSYSPARAAPGERAGRGRGAGGGDGGFGSGGGDGNDGGWDDGEGGPAGGGYGGEDADGDDGYEGDGWESGGDGYGGDGDGWDEDMYGSGGPSGSRSRRRAAARDPVAEARARADALLKEAQARSDELLAEAARQAGATAEAAKREAAERVAAAERKHEEENRAIAERAQADGYARGCAEAKAQYEQLIADAEKTLDQAGEEYAALMAGAEADAVSLAMDVAKKVIGEDMVINRQNMLSLIKDAFRHCSNKDRAILRVSPGDYDFIRMNRDVLLSMIEGVGRLEIKKDLSLGAGACFVETPFGSIDASVATRLSKIEDAFFKFMSARAREAL
ncbi:MAG: hypothetical protein LBL83_02720 [Clostridiales bacterium]|nr:hypothetical protein [Clostridiales bacterium]